MFSPLITLAHVILLPTHARAETRVANEMMLKQHTAPSVGARRERTSQRWATWANGETGGLEALCHKGLAACQSSE